MTIYLPTRLRSINRSDLSNVVSFLHHNYCWNSPDQNWKNDWKDDDDDDFDNDDDDDDDDDDRDDEDHHDD